MTERASLPFDGPERAAPTRRPVVTVTALTARIRTLLESNHGEVWVEGELANCRLWKTGHLYFTLRDDRAQLKGVMYRSAVRHQRFTPEDGLRVVARGRISVYEPKGDYQLVCEHLQPHGQGALQLAFEQLKRTLEKEGLLDADRKRTLPVLPRRIGVVTSLDGAAIRDILHVLTRRHPTVQVLISATRVQGEGAAGSIARALDRVADEAGVDVVIVGRGGGSLEDLWAFNETEVARAIAGCRVPIISAVGHETDVTISDLVADVQAPTPSAAAELVVAGRDELRARVDRFLARLRAGLGDRLRRGHAALQQLDRRPGLAGWRAWLAGRGRHAAELTHALRASVRTRVGRDGRRLQNARLALEAREPGRRLAAGRTRLVEASTRLESASRERVRLTTGQIATLAGRLDALSPLGVLARGYAVCWNTDRTAVIRNADAVAVGDEISITLQRGRLRAKTTGRD